MKLFLPFVSGKSSRGFTIIELLAVMVIIGILIAVAVPLMKGPSRGIQVGSTADILKGELLLAHQQAMTLNAKVEVRFFQKTETDPYTAYQIFNVEADGTVTTFSKLRTLPTGLGIPADTDLCPLLMTSLLKGTQANGVPAVKDWSYSAIDFSSSGQLADVTSANAFITMFDIAAPKTSGKLPANYAVVKVEPLTGMVSVIRP